MFATIEEIDFYIRTTLKQYGWGHLKIQWVSETTKSFLGVACIRRETIKLNKKILKNFCLFNEVLKHEIAHFEQYRRNGNKFLRKNGRWQLHGQDFKQICKEFKIPARTKIPV